MYYGSERLKPSPLPSPIPSSTTSDSTSTMTNLAVEIEDAFLNLLELAANDDIEGLECAIERDQSSVDEAGLWLCRKKGSSQTVLLQRTPLMVAATYGSVRALEVLLSFSTDVNYASVHDGATALHCAASGGSENAVSSVRALLAAGADPILLDSDGHRPADVIASLPHAPYLKLALGELLDGFRVSTSSSSSASPPLSASPVGGDGSPSSDSTSSVVEMMIPSAPEKKEYPIDPSLPDIKNSIYSTDEFRMFSFKVRPCSRAYSHDWTECPFVHPGENARRRDPRKFHYSCVPCPDFRKGACRRGDLCEYAHGVFECWLHPAQYRTRLCKDGTGCGRRVCFFAHTKEELRPLFVSTGSAVPSPRGDLMPGSPVAIVSSPFTPPMSPNGMAGHMPWPQPAVPALHLPGSTLSRLRTSLNARDLPAEELSMLQQELEAQQLLNDYSCFSPSQARPGAVNGSSRCKAVTPLNLDELFAPDISPRYNFEQPVYSPTHKSAVFHPFHHQQQSLLSPIKTSNVFPPVSFGVASPGGLSPRGMEPVSPMSSRLTAAAIVQREKQLQYQQMRSLSSRELGSGSAGAAGSPVGSPWARWGSPMGRLEWAVNGEELGRLRRSNSFELGGGEEPDVSWVQSLVKESPPELKERVEAVDPTVLSAWLEQMQIDKAAAS